MTDAKLLTLNAAMLKAQKTAKTALDAAVAASIDFTTAVADLSAYILTLAEPQGEAPIDVPPANAQVTMTALMQDQLLQAIAAGATRIETKGLVLTAYVDLKGATLVMLPGTEPWRAVVTLTGAAGIGNGRIESDLRKAIVSEGRSTRVDNMTFGDGVNYALHVTAGECAVTNSRTADTFNGYGCYLSPDTYVVWAGGFIGSSRNESSFRSDGGRADLRDVTINAEILPAPAKRTAIRGDFPTRSNGSEGLQVRRCDIRGLVGPNPLDGNDGGQLWGVDRFKQPNGDTVTTGPAIQSKLIQAARDGYAAGKSIADIARDCWTLAGLGNVSPATINATVNARAAAVGKTSSAVFEDSKIAGQLRLAARTVCRLLRTPVDAGSLPVFAGNSTPYYPDPQLVLVKDEAGDAPQWSIEQSPLKGAGLGIVPKDYPGISYDGKPITAAAVAA